MLSLSKRKKTRARLERMRKEGKLPEKVVVAKNATTNEETKAEVTTPENEKGKKKVDLFIPIFASARLVGWLAHNIENLLYCNKIIRPATKYVGFPLTTSSVLNFAITQRSCFGLVESDSLVSEIESAVSQRWQYGVTL